MCVIVAILIVLAGGLGVYLGGFWGAVISIIVIVFALADACVEYEKDKAYININRKLEEEKNKK